MGHVGHGQLCGSDVLAALATRALRVRSPATVLGTSRNGDAFDAAGSRDVTCHRSLLGTARAEDQTMGLR